MTQLKKQSPRKPLILLTNDDGFFSEGIQSLFRALKGLGQVFIVAPDREKSATSLSLTLHRPLRAQKINPHVYAVDGTPADCIYLALKRILPGRPALLASGINRGPNLGQQDISYSGTVAAAIQGTFLGIPSAAFSLLPDSAGKFSFGYAARIARGFAEKLLKVGLPEGVTLNINIPPPPSRGFKITCLGQRRYDPEIIEKKDPRRNSYYWIGPGNPQPSGSKKSDVQAVGRSYISVTPLHTDLTDQQLMRSRKLKKIFPIL
jgi:5'-nucleotidase